LDGYVQIHDDAKLGRVPLLSRTSRNSRCGVTFGLSANKSTKLTEQRN